MSRRLFVYGDNIDTDRIIAGKYTKTLHVEELALHVFEDLDPTFRSEALPGSIVVAGHNFGCGSSREQAAIALKAAGVAVVIARSFARIFFRNAINIGLPLIELAEHSIGPDSQLSYDLIEGRLEDRSQNRIYSIAPLPDFLRAIMDAGGLVPYLRVHGDYPPEAEAQLSRISAPL